MKTQYLVGVAALLAGGVFWQNAQSASKTPKRATRAVKAAPKKAKTKVKSKGNAPVYNFTMNSLAGTPVDLSRYADRVVLIANTASNCGFTPQYAGLEKLHQTYSAKGLSVLGFPANDFGNQEPGSDAEIHTFCQKNYGVKFDMFSKVVVTGNAKAPLFKYLTEHAPQTGEIGWNFEKFLISRNGQVVARFKSNVSPDSPELVNALQAELAKK